MKMATLDNHLTVSETLLLSSTAPSVHIITLFLLCFFQVSSPGDDAALYTADDFWQYH
ncbi:hypothetical protein NP493_6916g00000 [Ridgeia piscesae]|uniref:Uncharacterized protein n=1 Tax=Ridgeia piscesae TaxID=27915 RepID=A0AAD9IRJ5_RIDPI|nr:hypothetical protein NP493_6916g00000 [Ridgeia piscesae]